MEFVVGPVDVIPENGMSEYTVDGRCVLVCRSGEAIHAVSGLCPHRGAQLGQGSYDGVAVTCPWHDWEFEVASGCGITNPVSSLATYGVKICDGQILVTLPDN